MVHAFMRRRRRRRHMDSHYKIVLEFVFISFIYFMFNEIIVVYRSGI